MGHYNSDDDESGKEDEDTEFKDFMNEIKSTEESPGPPIPSGRNYLFLNNWKIKTLIMSSF